jgi:hypothetical protein
VACDQHHGTGQALTVHLRLQSVNQASNALWTNPNTVRLHHAKIVLLKSATIHNTSNKKTQKANCAPENSAIGKAN